MTMPFIIWFYRFLFLPVLLLLLPYHLLRMIRRGGYLKDFSQRLGLGPGLPKGTKPRVWIQAVSVGEVLAIESLVNCLLEKDVEVIVTATTSTGYQLALEKYEGKTSFTGLFPLDFLPGSFLCWHRIKPTLAILMESEVWPEHIHQARKRNVPVLLVNARMSDHSFRSASKFAWAYGRLLQGLAGISASGQQDLKRYVELGFPMEKTTCSGNLKLDFDLGPEFSKNDKQSLLQQIGFYEPGGEVPMIILGSSTWPEEESFLLDAFQSLIEEGIDCRLLLAPRHMERREEIRRLLARQHLPWHFRTDDRTKADSNKIYVADTTGELRQFTQLATVTFIGKTLPPNKGSQTPIEAAAFGVPSIFGPETTNFRDICQQLVEAGASVRIKNVDGLLPTLREILRNPQQREQMTLAAKKWHQANLGATRNTLDFLEPFLQPRKGPDA